jgi:hypothetical protein
MAIIKLKNVRISFPSLFEAKAVNGEGEPRFSAVFVVEPGSENAKLLAQTLNAVAKEKWGAKAENILTDLKAKGRVCYLERPKTNQSGEVYDGFEGMHHISASNTARVQVIDRDTSPLTPADGRPYGGCFVDASIDVWTQDNSWGKRINAKLRWVQFRGDGDAFSGGAPVSQDEFESIADGAAAEDMV